MHPNRQLLTTLYQAFQAKDYATVMDCYHPQAIFTNPLFTVSGRHISAMWQSFCETDDLTITVGPLSVSEHAGWVHWEAAYTYPATGRAVNNRIQSHVVIDHGKIILHDDRFDFWEWSRQAWGLRGTMVGWMPRFRRWVQQGAHRRLAQVLTLHPHYQHADRMVGEWAACGAGVFNPERLIPDSFRARGSTSRLRDPLHRPGAGLLPQGNLALPPRHSRRVREGMLGTYIQAE